MKNYEVHHKKITVTIKETLVTDEMFCKQMRVLIPNFYKNFINWSKSK